MSFDPPGPPRTPGKARGLQRLVSAEGFVQSVAVDHVNELNELLDPEASFAERAAAKADLVRAVASSCAAVLVDAHFGLGPAILSGAVPRDLGLVVSLEDGDYSLESPKDTRLREGWDVAKARAAGVDAVKLLWWYRPDLDPELAARQRALLEELLEQCAEHDVLSVIEPIWYRTLDVDPADPEWQRARAAGIVEAAMTAEQLGADVLKLEFPADLDAPGGEKLAIETLARLDTSVTRPWVVLSAGVPFETFARQLELSCRAGASGYIAGRSLWRETVTASEAERETALETLRYRLARLNQITQTYGRPIELARSLEGAVGVLAEDWYR